MTRRDIFNLLPLPLIGLIPDRRKNVYWCRVEGGSKDQFFVHVSYKDCKPGDRGQQYSFLTETVTLEPKGNGDPNPKGISGSYQFSGLKYTNHAYAHGFWTFHFKKDHEAAAAYMNFVRLANSKGRQWFDEKPLSTTAVVIVRQWPSISMKPEDVKRFEVMV